jgi:hypothetical protein
MPDTKQVFTFLELDPTNPWTDPSFNFVRVIAPDDYEEKVGTAAVVTTTGVTTDLNADLLDGKHASFFAKSVHAHEWKDVSKMGSRFLDLSDVDETAYTWHGGEYIRVKTDESGLEFITGAGGGVDEFKELIDCPGSYTSHAGKFVKVNAGETGLEFGAFAFGSFLDLSDVTEPDYSGHGGQFVKVNAGASGLEFGLGGAGVTNFLDLLDVPDYYTGYGGRFVKVRSDESGLEFVFVDLGTGGYTGTVDIPNNAYDAEGHMISAGHIYLNFNDGLLTSVT